MRRLRKLVLGLGALASLGLGCAAPEGAADPAMPLAAAPLASSSPPKVEAPQASPSPPASASPAASSPASPAVPVPPRRRYALAAIGDSLTDPRSHGGGYLDVLRERCPRSRFESFGVGGNMVNMMRRRLLRDVFGEVEGAPRSERPPWTHVLVFGGLGDVLSNLTAKRTAAAVQRDLTEMVRLSRERGAEVLVLTTHPWAGSGSYDGIRAAMARDINAWILEAGRTRAIDATFDTRPVLSCGDLERLCDTAAAPDRLHLSKGGQRILGEALHAAHFSDCE